jgi:glycosyl transferase family 87
VLLIFSPLAALPYLPALFAWQALSLVAIGLTLRAILQDRRALFVALASPLTPMVLAGGQNAFMTAALLGAGLVWLDRKPALAGGFFGSLLYKPQLALMIGPLILFTRSWRALVAGILTVAILVLLSLILWGPDSWRVFFASLSLGREDIMEQGVTGFFKSASLFAIARQWGAPIDLAYAIQGVGAVVGIWAVWFVRNATPYVRAAVVCAGAALSTPYLFDYDMAVVGVGAAFLYAEARRGSFLAYEKSALAFIWAAPWISRSAAQLLALPLSQVAMILLLCLAVRRARSGHGHAAVDVDGLPGDVAGFAAR